MTGFPSVSASEQLLPARCVHAFIRLFFTHPCDHIYSFGSNHTASLRQRQEAAAGQEVMSTRKSTPHESLSDYFNSLMDE